MTTLKRLITQTWNPTLHPYPPLSKKRFGKPLVNLLPSILSHTDPSWDHERVSTSPVQPHIDIRWVVVPSLRDRLSLLHIPEWFISFLSDYSGLWGCGLTFYVGGWRRGSSWQKDILNFRNVLTVPWAIPSLKFIWEDFGGLWSVLKNWEVWGSFELWTKGVSCLKIKRD